MKKEQLSMEVLSKANETRNKVEGLEREFYKQVKCIEKKVNLFFYKRNLWILLDSSKQWGNQIPSLVFTAGKMKIAIWHLFFAGILSEILIYQVLHPGEIRLNWYV